MTKVILLECLKEFTKTYIKDLRLPVQPREEDEFPPPDRAVAVYTPCLPELRSYARKAPFITHEIVTGKDKLEPDPRTGKRLLASTVVRTCFCVYHRDEQQGRLALLTLMEQLRIALLEEVVIGGQFMLDLDAGMETLVYPGNPAQVAKSPFYLGEMISTWNIPPVKRLASDRVVHGMPPRDPYPAHLEETRKLKGAK